MYIYIRVIYPFAPSNIDNPLWPLLISPMQRKTEKSLQRKNQRGGTWVFLSNAFFVFGGRWLKEATIFYKRLPSRTYFLNFYCLYSCSKTYLICTSLFTSGLMFVYFRFEVNFRFNFFMDRTLFIFTKTSNYSSCLVFTFMHKCMKNVH